MRRWICPTCGQGVHAPDRPRRDDVRRYCLTCSAKSGRLVERSCPALDRQRATSCEKRAARTVTKKQKDRAAEAAIWAAGPFDMKAELRRYLKLPVFAPLLRYPPDVNPPRRSRTKDHTSGYCTYSRPAHITWTIGLNPYDAPGCLLHELCHAVAGREGHSSRYWALVQRACREAFPDVTFDFFDARQGWQMQDRIAGALRRHYEEETV